MTLLLLIVAPLYVGLSEACVAHPDSPWRVALPLGLGLIVVQRAADHLVAATGIDIRSSLMMVGLLIWFLMLLALPTPAPKPQP